ncbi:Acetylcholinesterase-1 like protein [Argiope bruennichi]|uniref:Acetylcholinesterase-1 like protein n=1 Tax=Argiope bruennichi TaxID=94029 RepID=A0A8T0EFP5_ARGBR|nr:Acetylcholinesterase-1 like protein [Argiope bruennichi]
MTFATLTYLITVLWHAIGTSTTVETPLGKIEGVMSKVNGAPIKMFLGVPFAKLPVGSRRFLKPESVEAWIGTLKANKTSSCMHAAYRIAIPMLPVLFWIHGGGYTLGSNRMDVYDGRVLAQREDVVVVITNYRVGLFGFLTSNTSDVLGNVGLYDVVMALRWVKDNIEYFGGDKDRITISGESDGHPDEFGFFGQKNPKINKTHATSLLQSTFSNYTDPQKYIDFYLKDIPDDDYDLIRRQVYTAIGDTTLLCPTLYFAESYAERNRDAYFYFLTHRPSNTPWAKWMGVAHFEDVQFVFGRPVRVPKDYNRKEIRLSSQVMKLWANFAKNGHPGVLYPKWPKYSKENHTYMTIDVDHFGRLGTGPHMENCDFLRSYFGF